MKERILQILQDKHLTSAKLADMINVQRSSISHILSGRNKPSMDFLHKILTTFDDISGDWLITGLGTMYKSKNLNGKPVTDIAGSKKAESTLFQTPEQEPKKDPQAVAEPAKTPVPDVIQALPSAPSKSIKRIIIYYSDNSYEELFPAKE